MPFRPGHSLSQGSNQTDAGATPTGKDHAMAECKHGLRAGCYYCHAWQSRPGLNDGVRQKQEARTVVARGALTQNEWRRTARPISRGLAAWVMGGYRGN
jgi:hypothetical protein